MTRSGRIALAGRPNVGKSSLLNAIIGTPLAIVSPKPQATQLPVTGIHTVGDTQLVLVDLPGLFDPGFPLQRSLRQLALDQLRTIDLILHLHPAADAPAPDLLTLAPDAAPIKAGVVTVYTKADLVSAERRAALTTSGALMTDIHRPETITALLAALAQRLPERPFQHPTDDLATQPVRFFVGEYLREGAFDALEEELPYALAAEVDEFDEDREPVYIRATLFVERESQKGIVIGRGGATLKRIGSHARVRLEALLGQRVYLETRVKVLPRWRRDKTMLARFGFPVPDDESH
ncbi:MAG TPA: GTPase Era [Gemmatimonadales bacterium]|jgi:GTP-binding protein Era|nr:GTPase Era [Gemmatimonadales bacterium]